MNRSIPVLEKVIQFSLLTFAIFSLFSISITQISFAIGSLFWLLKTHLTRTWSEIRGTRVGIAILAFCLAYFISLTTAVDLENSINYMKKLIQLIIFLGCQYGSRRKAKKYTGFISYICGSCVSFEWYFFN